MPFLTEKVYQRLATQEGWREEEDAIICESLERGLQAKEVVIQLQRVGPFLRTQEQVEQRIGKILMAGQRFDTLRDFREAEAKGTL